MKTKLIWLMAMLWAGIAGAQQIEDDPMEDEGLFYYNEDTTTAYTRTEFMDLLYGGIPTDWYPSGILYDKSLDTSNIHLYPGVSDHVADYGQWLGVYQALRHARPADASLKTLNQVMQKAARLYYDLPGDPTTVFAKEWIHLPIGVQHYTYQRFKAEAIAEGRIENGPAQITPSSPDDIETLTTFMAAPMLADSIFYDEVWFSVPDKNGFLYGNLGEPNLYQVDFGDGNGLVEMQPGTRRKVAYTPGLKTMTIRARYGSTWRSNRASVYVAGSAQTQYALRGGDDDHYKTKWILDELSPEYLVIGTSESGTQEKGMYRVLYGCGNTTNWNLPGQPYNPKIKKPFIIITGYNPFGKGIEKQVENYNNIGLLYTLRQRGFDVVVFKPSSGVDHIANNGAVVRELIKKINDEKAAAGSYEENIVLGFSAGALAARYALAWMEQDAYKNNNPAYHPHTRLFLSWEGEHQGAHIPLAVQHNLTYDCNNTPILLSLPTILNEWLLLGSRSAQDFLRYHRSQTGSQWQGNAGQSPHPSRTAYLNNLTAKRHAYTEDPTNVYPRFMRKVAVSNGSGDAQAFNIGHGQMLADFTKIGTYWVWERVKAMGIQAGSYQNVFHARKSWVFFNWEDIRRTDWPNADHDRCPGATYNFLDNYLQLANNYYRLPVGWYNAHHYVPDCFVPTTSALDIQNHGGNLFYNIKANGLLNSGIDNQGNPIPNQYYGYPHIAHPDNQRTYTPFDAVFVHPVNSKHTPNDSLRALRNFILQEAAPTTHYLQNRQVGEHLSGQWAARANLKVNGKIVVGKDVTFETPVGNYTVLPGANQDLWARTSVELKPGFEAQPGAVFIARVLDGDIFFCNNIEPIPAPVANRPGKTTEMETVTTDKSTLTLAPNPASSEVSLSVGNMQEIRILTLTGTELFSQTLTSPVDATTLPIGSYPAGIYLVQVTTSTGTVFTQKLVIQPH